MMKTAITDFVRRFGARIDLGERYIVARQNRFYLANPRLARLPRQDFYYGGIYLGKTRETKFFPGFGLLDMISRTNANRIVVDAKSAWLFVCGRDIFKKGIMQTLGSPKKGTHVLVLNEYGECLGFGKMLHDLEQEKTQVVVKNVLDVGDFLRRERQARTET